MNRAERRIRKARIRAKLLRRIEERLRTWRGYYYSVTTDEIAAELRRFLRNEGRHNKRIFRCGSTECPWCIDNRLYQARRESERMEQEHKRWELSRDEFSQAAMPG